jgi:calcineurin-like phosphoesterase family protein
MHFGHESIIRYENRPFIDVAAMDATIIENWNRVVAQDDSVFVLGDVSFYPKERTVEIIASLRGRKRLILGNHDFGRTESFWKGAGFEFVSPYPICLDEFYWLSHEPMHLTSAMPYVNIHGHIHAKTMSTDGAVNRYVNVSVEHIGYTPILFEEIKKRFA